MENKKIPAEGKEINKKLIIILIIVGFIISALSFTIWWMNSDQDADIDDGENDIIMYREEKKDTEIDDADDTIVNPVDLEDQGIASPSEQVVQFGSIAVTEWKDFEDAEYYFTVKYPSNWKTEKLGTAQTPSFQEPNNICRFVVVELDAEDTYEKQDLRDKGFTESQTQLSGNLTGTRFEGQQVYEDGSKTGIAVYVYVDMASAGLHYRMNGSTHLDEYADECQTILDEAFKTFDLK